MAGDAEPGVFEANAPEHGCAMHIVDAGYPCRTDIVLQRERGLFTQMVAELAVAVSRQSTAAATTDADEGFLPGGESIVDDGEPIDTFGGNGSTGVVTMEQLEAVLGTPVKDLLQAGVFVAGRCAPADAAGASRLDQLLRGVLGSFDLDDLGANAIVAVEAAMSLVLRGHDGEGRPLLVQRAAPDSKRTMGDWMAAFYLAELGDESGYPTMVQLLGAPDGFTRLMAARHLVGFLPFDGDEVGGEVIDIAARLMALVDDDDELVSQEIPGLLAEADVDDLEDLLDHIATNARHERTREIAEHVLEDLDG